MEVQTNVAYDPRKKYKWDQDAEFILKGSEFGTILNALRGFLNTSEAQKIISLERANMMIEEAMSRSVDAGIAKEQLEDDFLKVTRK